MSVPSENVKENELELNFKKQREHFTYELEKERKAKMALEQELQALKQRAQKPVEEEDEDDDPYIDKKALKKSLTSVREQTKEELRNEVRQEMRSMFEQEKKQSFLKQNPDFNEIMSPEMLQKFGDKHPDIAEEYLSMPEGFDRQRFLYKNMKALGMHKKEEKIQDKIEEKKRGGHYQPSGTPTGPYTSVQGDFSPEGQKAAYMKVKALREGLRI